MDLTALFPLGVIFSIAGGLLGSVWASLEGNDKKTRAVFEGLISAVCAAAVVENYLPIGKVWLCGACGVIVGLLVGHALDVVKIIAPTVMKDFVEGMATKFLGYKKKNKG